MKIFSRGDKTAAQPVATVAPTPQEAPKVEKPPEPAQPDVAQILESSVKDISDKVARLASTVETRDSEREAFESKLSLMEDRMRKLSSLTEMISAQYNPFIGDAPSEREALPAAEKGLAPPPLPPQAAAPAPVVIAAPELELPDFPPDAPEDEPSFAATAPAPAPPQEHAPAASVRVEMFADDFQSSLVLIKWADLLLQNTQSREGVTDLVEYYHNIGWIGDTARDQLHAYVEGIAFDEAPGGAPDWRATAEFHEISLLFLEKLRNLERGR